MSASPSEYNLLTAWDKSAPLFKTDIAEFNSEETNRLIDEKLNDFRASIVAFQNPQDDSEAAIAPDFNQLKLDCTQIMVDNLPKFQMPAAKKLLLSFFQVLLAATLILIVVGLTVMTLAEVAALIGILSIATFNFKGLTLGAAAVGGVLASVNAVSMFSPMNVASQSLDRFLTSIEPPATNAPR